MSNVKKIVETSTDRPPCYFSFENVTLDYGDGKKVLDNCKLWLYKGKKRTKRYALIGDSGMGKTSIANLMMGNLVPQQGKVFFNDERICYEEDFLRNHRASIGLVSQGLNGAISYLNVIENVKRPAALKGYCGGKVKELAQTALLKVGLNEDLWKKTPDQLSGGELQRMLIAKTIVREPQFVIYDEPTSALDRPNGKRVINTIINTNIPTLIVTHDPSLIAPYMDGLIILYKGKITDITCLKENPILGTFRSSYELLDLRRRIKPPKSKGDFKKNKVANNQLDQDLLLEDLPLCDEVEITDETNEIQI